MVGVLFIILIVGKSVTRHFREQLTVQVMIKDKSPEEDVLRLQRQIEGMAFAGRVNYTSSEEAARIMQAELGEEFVEFLGYNPLPASLDISVNPEFSSLDSLPGYLSGIESSTIVSEVIYQKDLLQQINENLARWGLGLAIVGILFLIIALVLIVNTIELAIFSQRFIIRSMQLVGATHWFIQRPFLRKGMQYGLSGALFSLALISLGLYMYREELQDVIDVLIAERRYLVMIGGVIGVGVLVSWLATAYAVRRFLYRRLEQLH